MTGPSTEKPGPVARFMGHIARPWSIISTSTAASGAILVIAWRIDDGLAGAAYITAVLAGLVGLYGFKAWEERPGRQARRIAEAEAGEGRSTDG